MCGGDVMSQVMAGSGHLQTFRLLRFLRNRNSADGHANYGIQMAVSSSGSNHEISCFPNELIYLNGIIGAFLS